MSLIAHVPRTTLAAAGAWTSGSAAIVPVRWTKDFSGEVNLVVWYWQKVGATDGYPKLRVINRVSDKDTGKAVEIPDPLLDGAVTIVSGVATGKSYAFQQELQELKASDGVTPTMVSWTLRRGIDGFRVELAEVGDTGDAGDFRVDVQFIPLGGA